MPRRLDYTDRFRTDVPHNSRHSGYGSSGSNAGSPTTAQILALVDRATSSQRHSPDYALNLQIADYVNEKKGSVPREVAMKLAKLAYPSYGRRAILALAVLDVLVKNCGYPFHLAVSRRDFLNTLVRPFGINPPLHYSHLQNVILGMLQEWDLGLVKHSKYRDDLVNITEMTRLLQRKGYMFPEVSMEDVAALRPTDDALKSAAELEAEDREVQSAKLQELIRSGSPDDLKEANRLMSLMAGFRESRIDYHAKMAAELDKVRRKADLFSELISQADPETLNGDVLVDLHQSLKSAVPKIQHILSDRDTMEDDPEAHQKVLDLQAAVETVLNKYSAIKSGADPASVAPSKAPAAIDSLIDIGDEPAPESNNDLLSLGLGGLSLGQPNTSQPSTSDILQLGSPSSTPSAPSASPTPAPAPAAATSDPFAEFTSSSAAASVTPTAAAAPPTQLYSDESITVSYTVTKRAGETDIQFRIANAGSKKITNLESQFAPPRSLNLVLGPLSTTSIEPRAAAVDQKVTLVGSAAPKLRWRINYNFGVEPKSIGGDIKSL